MNNVDLKNILEKELGKENFLLIPATGPTRVKNTRTFYKGVRDAGKPKVQIVDFVDERRKQWK